MVIAIEVEAYRLSDGQVDTLRFSTGGFITRPSDTPANAWFEPVIKSAPSLERVLFDQAGTYGATKVTAGNVLLVNEGGALDYLLTDYAFDGRRFSVRMGDVDQPFASWLIVMTGTLSDMAAQDTSVALVIQDRLADLAIIEWPTYAGNNVAPNGLEGTANDLKDQAKPRLYGVALNVTPKAVNTSKLIYQVSDQACAITAVYDNGAALTRGADYASTDDMQATAPAAGQFRCIGGYLRLGSAPAGTVACDAAGPMTRAADLLVAIARDAGVPEADIVQADVDALNALAPAAVGVWADSTQTPQSLMDFVAGSIGAWYGFDRLSRLRMGRVDAPAGVPAAEWGREVQETVQPSSAGVPAWSVSISYARNYTVQSNVAGAAGVERAAWLAQEYRTAKATSDSTKVAWPHAQTLTFETGLVDAVAAQAEAQRRLDLYKVRRMTLDADVPVTELGAVDLGDIVGLDTPRYRLADRLLCVIGINSGFASGKAALVLWG
ncbi:MULTISPECIES: hypothetical protein [unclassified Burkholderia]|uniref:hypothetical protein n=1 Tax=unclassified Burkholderia TaxID=2613784 RepID=UPI000F56CDE4|nr:MULTISPECIES: hypothetical protein [unclassified Burkholderia]RQR81464.1 hypothetical protein DIE10_17840 [Burkholderia sp. Bp9011]RQR91041.1 hypothetical protein DIE09_20080 [Burkholderia sp. Bp9010]RQS75188.1 hypothetical protein DID97_16445 [Burkholderia sp. Bp8977]